MINRYKLSPLRLPVLTKDQFAQIQTIKLNKQFLEGVIVRCCPMLWIKEKNITIESCWMDNGTLITKVFGSAMTVFGISVFSIWFSNLNILNFTFAIYTDKRDEGLLRSFTKYSLERSLFSNIFKYSFCYRCHIIAFLQVLKMTISHSIVNTFYSLFADGKTAYATIKLCHDMPLRSFIELQCKPFILFSFVIA